MKSEEARDSLSDMRDRHLQFVEGASTDEKWLESYLKEAWVSTSFAVIAALSYTKEPLCLMALVLPLFVGLLAH